MSSMPLSKKMMEGRGNEPIRSHEQFMEDQIKYGSEDLAVMSKDLAGDIKDLADLRAQDMT